MNNKIKAIIANIIIITSSMGNTESDCPVSSFLIVTWNVPKLLFDRHLFYSSILAMRSHLFLILTLFYEGSPHDKPCF